MADVMLIQVPLYAEEYFSRGSSHTASILPPLGLASIAAVLRRAGHRCEIIDGLATQIPLAELVAKARNADVIGISSISTYVKRVIELIEALRGAGSKAAIMVGGPHATILPASLLSRGADFAVIGEGEETTLELVEALAAGRSARDVPGLAFLDHGELHRSPRRPPIDSLDSLPLPARDLLPMHLYRNSGARSRRQPSLSMFTSRGCPGLCTFCNKATFGTKVRYFGVERIVEEFFLLRDRYGARDVAIWDDNFVSDHGIVHRVCDELLRKNFRTPWSAEARLDMVDEDLLRHMKRSGCDFIAYGIESGSQRVLDAMNKRITLELIREKIRLTQKVGIPIRGYFMMGFPGETEADLKRTIDFALELDIDVASFTIFVPLPGTGAFQRAKTSPSFDPDFFYKRVYPEFNFPDHAIYTPDGMTGGALLRMHKKAYDTYYLRPGFILKNLLSIRSVGDAKRYLDGGLNIIRNALQPS